MAKFMLDGQEYCGGGSQIVELTQSEYDALPDTKKTDNILYAITDCDELSAENMAFDDSETQLGVNNVQDAIVEQNKNFGGLKISTAQVVLDKTAQVNTFQTDITYNNYCLLGLTWEWGANVERNADGIVGYSLAPDGKLTIAKVDISYGGTNTMYITAIHD